MTPQPEPAPATAAAKGITPGSPAAGREIYHGILGDIALHCAELSEADPVGVYATLLGMCGTWIGPRPHLMVQGTRHPLLIWPLLLGPSGSGRKGTSEGQARRFMRAAADGIDDITVSGLSSGEGLIARIADVTEQNSVPAAGLPAGTDDKRLWVRETEFATVMNRAGRDGSTLAAILRQAWDGDALHVLTKQAVRASASHIGITGHIPPAEFLALMRGADMAGGTFNRFLPVFVQRTRLIDDIGVHEDPGFDPLVHRLRGALVAAGRVGQITLHPDARMAWRAVYVALADLDEHEHDRWMQFVQRAGAYCLRIAALLAALDGTADYAGGRWDVREVTQIRSGHIRAAAGLVDYVISTARYVLGPAETDPDYARILRAVVERGEMTRTDIGRMFSPVKRARVLSGLIETMAADPRLSVTEEGTGGRTRTVVRALHQGLNATNATGDGPGLAASIATNATVTEPDGGQEEEDPTRRGLTNPGPRHISRASLIRTPARESSGVSRPSPVAFVALVPDEAIWTARMADEPQPIDYEESP